MRLISAMELCGLHCALGVDVRFYNRVLPC